MATITVDTILKRCNTLLNDAIWVRWPKQELLDYYNDSVRAIVLRRPDANASDIEFTCVAGTQIASFNSVLHRFKIVSTVIVAIRYAPVKKNPVL
jgi:hypothetical protein